MFDIPIILNYNNVISVKSLPISALYKFLTINSLPQRFLNFSSNGLLRDRKNADRPLNKNKNNNK